MRQAIMIEPGKIEYWEITVPELQPNEVLIKVKRIGICGSDIHVFHGLHPYTSYPVVQGHEVSGVIARVGRDVNFLMEGDSVVFMPQLTCGECYSCRHGMYHICDQLKVMGFQADGAAQEYFPISADKVLKLSENVSLDHAALIEPISVAVHALSRFGNVAGLNVLVLGAGTIGNLVAQVALASGARRILITDINDYKLDHARQCGMDTVVNPTVYELRDAIQEIFGPDKADLILECVGVQATISQAVANARKGSVIIVVGVFGNQPLVDLGLVQDRELNLVGTLMYQRKDYERAIDLVSHQLLHLDPLITHRFPFDQYMQAYQTIEASGGKYMKVMIDL